jgi:DNA invertase Pin-like site-specific DNA recombinase
MGIVAVYVRVSTDKQELENQLQQLRPFCQKQGWEIYKEYTDICSGKEESRPAFDQLFQDAHKRLFDVVLFWDISRFSRAGIIFTLQKLKELDNLGMTWHSYQDLYLSTAGDFKEVVISILAKIAQIEREKISARTKAGLERAEKAGRKLGRRHSKLDFKSIWREYYRQGKIIARAAKLLPYSYGTVYRVISQGVTTQEAWEQLIHKRGGGFEGEN